mgnify:FL=1
MAKSPFEKAIQKQQKEAKKLAEQEARRQRANAIVSGQPVIGGMRMLDPAAEEILQVILSTYDGNPGRNVQGNYDIIPDAYAISLPLEFEKLNMYGMISNPRVWIGGMWETTLTPQGVTYFEDKERAMEKAKSEKEKQFNIGSIIANGSNLVLGDVINSALSIDNSTSRIEQEIEEKGGEEKEELRELLEEVKELIENMQDSRHIPKNKGLFSKLSNHLEKHGWFYGEVVGLLGSAVMQMLPK